MSTTKAFILIGRCLSHLGWNKNTINLMAYKQQISISHSPKDWKSKIMVRFWLEPSFRLQTAIFSLHLHKVERRQGGPQGPFCLFIRALIPFMKAPFSELNSLPKVLPPKSIRLRIKGSTSEFGGTKQSFYNTWHLLFGGLSQIEKLHRRI